MNDTEQAAIDAIAQGFWLDLCEKDDRTSPEEYPEMCLITDDELRDMLRYVAALSQRSDAGKEEVARAIADTVLSDGETLRSTIQYACRIAGQDWNEEAFARDIAITTDAILALGAISQPDISK